MDEPDEALLWAREQAKQLREAPNDPTRDLSAEIDAGMHDDELSDMAHGYRRGYLAGDSAATELMRERIKRLKRALINTGTNLLAAISLLENGGKKAAPSDKMFEIMLSDYRAAADRAAALLKETE